MLICKNIKILLTSLFLIFNLTSCTHSLPRSESISSSRDISPDEKIFLSDYSFNNERNPADWSDNCTSYIAKFFRPKPNDNVFTKPLPELTQLNPEIKIFPNGKKYTQYKADINVMNKYPEYEDFLKETAEIIFEPVEPFGHINLRIGKNVYSFNFIQSTSVNKFYPRMKNSADQDMPGSMGYIFEVGNDKIIAIEKEIEAFYNSSSSANVPPFDAYSPLLKIHSANDEIGKTLKFKSDSPKFGNENSIKGNIFEENGNYFLGEANGVKVPVIKKGNEYFTQSFSCSSSAAHIMELFFGIEISYGQAAKSLQQSLANGNINKKISPIGVIIYHEKK